MISKVIFLLIILFFLIGCVKDFDLQEKADETLSLEQEYVVKSQDAVQEDEVSSIIEYFNLEEYNEYGEKKWEVTASTAEFIQEIVNLTDVQGVVYGKEGRLNVESDMGRYMKDSRNMHLNSNVIARTQDSIILITDELIWEAESQRIYTDSEVIVKDNKLKIRGQGGWATPNENKINFNRNVITEVKPSTIITCKGPLEIDYQQNFAIFNDNVVVIDEQGKMFADEMIVYFNKDQQIERIIAKENVKIQRNRETTISEKAEYIASENRVILTGKPQLLIYPEQ